MCYPSTGFKMHRLRAGGATAGAEEVVFQTDFSKDMFVGDPKLPKMGFLGATSSIYRIDGLLTI